MSTGVGGAGRWGETGGDAGGEGGAKFGGDMGMCPSGDGGARLTGDMGTGERGVCQVLVLELGLRRCELGDKLPRVAVIT